MKVDVAGPGKKRGRIWLRPVPVLWDLASSQPKTMKLGGSPTTGARYHPAVPFGVSEGTLQEYAVLQPQGLGDGIW